MVALLVFIMLTRVATFNQFNFHGWLRLYEPFSDNGQQLIPTSICALILTSACHLRRKQMAAFQVEMSSQHTGVMKM